MLCSITFSPENRAVYEKMWKSDTAGQVIRIARYVPKSTSTHSEYKIFIAFRLEQWLHECGSMLLDTCIARLL
jgi:hypothetical protein